MRWLRPVIDVGHVPKSVTFAELVLLHIALESVDHVLGR
jgi:hypothetical protein